MYRKNAICDESLQSPGPASATASKQGPLAKSSKQPETTGKKNIPSTKDGSRVRSAEQGQVAGESAQSKVLAAKRRFVPDNSEILTTDTLYFSSAAHGAPDHDLLDGMEVLGMIHKMWFNF